VRLKSTHNQKVKALTLVEMVVATSAMAVILATLVPALAGIRSSWETRRANDETVQNARVLTDHLQRHLATAERITAVSAPDDENGTVEFTGADGGTWRYAVGAQDYVQFGPTGNLADLAGPVGRFQVVCYDGNDFVTPVGEPARIQFVTVITTFANAASLGRDKTFTCSVFLRSAVIGAEEEESVAPGIALQEGVTWDGVDAVIDSYRSSEGSYSAASAGADAVVSVNAIGTAAIALSGGAMVHGNVYVGPGGEPDTAIVLTGGAAISGILGSMAEVVSIPGLTVPGGLSLAAYPGGQLSLTGNAEQTLATNYELDEIQLRGNARLLIDGDVTLLVNGEVEMRGHAQIKLLSGSTLTIFARDTFEASGSSGVNASAGLPSMLRIYMIGSNKDLIVGNNATVQAVVQNPYGAVTVSGSGQFLGKIKAAHLDGGGQIHMDLDCDF
jgi:type II secretory pathway pseudopilin PulG